MGINILENEQPIVINGKLAKVIGLSESIIIQQMNYWIQRSKHIIEGRRWVYNTYTKWQEQISFFCESTIRRLIKKLEGLGIIISGNFNKSKKDNTKWYTIDYEVLNKLSEQVYGTNAKGDSDTDDTPDVDADTRASSMPAKVNQLNCSNLAVKLSNLNRPLPENTTETEDEEDKKGVRYLEEIGSTSGVLTEKVSAPGANLKDVIDFFNSNMHPITPHEYEKLVGLYGDIKNGDLILKAMELAVENGARSFRYIEVILHNWMDLKGSTPGVTKEGKGDNHGEGKFSKWGSGQYSRNYKKAESKGSGKYAGFKAKCTEAPDFTDEDLKDFI